LDCPLCQSSSGFEFYQDKARKYLRCDVCKLVYVPSQFYLSTNAEKAEYDKHCNSPDDLGYRRFLSRIATPLLESIAPASWGLDFGCGPGPTLSVMLEEQGHQVNLFDIYYANHPEVWEQHYDFICATEVFEHLSQPARELKKMLSVLKSNGCLALMTKLVFSREAFATWHYKNDPTHICFYSELTFDWIAGNYNLRWQKYADDAFIFVRN
jgi:SAM-dependent methyltransferase